MAALLEEHGRDDFRIEKDKCTMYRFLEKNKLPTVHVVNYWYGRETFLGDIQTGVAFKSAAHWPVFLKFCHLTQGSALSTRRIDSKRYINENWESVSRWVDQKWSLRADDMTRPWRAASNVLTDNITAGALVQLSANLTYNPVRAKWGVVEMKTEVLWGRAFIGALLPDDDNTEFPIVTRGENGSSGQIEVFDSYVSVITHRGELLSPDAWYAWILEDGYLDCVWALAERVSRIMRADQVRIDIFITRGQPGGCIINENSLSSGQNYGPYTHYLNQIWLEPFVNEWYTVGPRVTGRAYPRVYDQMEQVEL